jgi:hypothetical protein
MEVLHMRFIKSLLALVPLVLLVSACGRMGGADLDVQTFNLDHRSGHEVAELIVPYVFSDRAKNPGSMSATDDALTVRETRDNLEKIARVLEEFDQPIPGVRLYFQLIEADSFQEEDPAIADVVAELKSLFRYGGYRLLGEATVPVAGGTRNHQEFSYRFLGPEDPMTVQSYAQVLRDGSIRLEPVSLSDPWNRLLETSVTVALGQTVVIGGTPATRGDEILILTVRAEAEQSD